MAQSDDIEERKEAVKLLHSSFVQFPDKECAWNDLCWLMQDVEGEVQNVVIEKGALGSAFTHVPNKNQAWEDLCRLTQYNDLLTRWGATIALGSAFYCIPEKEQAWDELHKLLHDKDEGIRNAAIDALDTAFSCVPDKEQAWYELIRLTNDEDVLARWGAAYALDTAFLYAPNKDQAWNDLIHLAKDKYSEVRSVVIYTLGLHFPLVQDKEKAWNDLHRLTLDKNSVVRRSTAGALVSAFPYLPYKNLVCSDLHRLTKDEEHDVRSKAYYSIGRINILKISEIDNKQKIKKYLDIAVENFDKSIGEKKEDNPALFCSPFYKSYSTIIFEPEKSEFEINKFIEEAKKASAGSESKVELLEAVENLISALKEATLDEQKRNLKTYVRYLDRTAEIIEKHKGKQPVLCSLLERGIKTTKERINALILEIQEKAEIACQQSKGTPIEEIACAANQEVQKVRIEYHELMTQGVENLIFSLKSKIPLIPENKLIHDKIEEIRKQRDMTKQYEMLAILIALIPTASVHMGDNITLKDVANSGENIQVVLKGDENKNINENVSIVGDEVKKSWIEPFNLPATIAAFIGFLTVEIGTFFYPITYNHIIGVVIAVVVFVIVSTINKR